MIYNKLNNILNPKNYFYRLFVGIFLILCGLNTKYSHASQLLSSIKLYERGFFHHSRSYSYTNFYNFSDSAQLYHREVEHDSEQHNGIFKIENNNGIKTNDRKKDVLIIGGGQASLATAYFLRCHKLNYTILDSEKEPGGAWQHGWDSLHLFSPAQWSSLPGWQMPTPGDGDYPSKTHVVYYLAEYEKRYQIPVERPVKVKVIRREKGIFIAHTDKGEWESPVIVNATGKWGQPFIPDSLGKDIYQGKQIHSAFYRNPDAFKDQRVLIVGGGNSGAQIVAEVSKIAKTTWVTLEEPLFLPDEVDGRVLFERATERWKALQEGRSIEIPQGGLGDIVMVPSVKDARMRYALTTVRPFKRFNEDGVVWQDGTYSQIDSVIWCTGFSPALEHLWELGIVESDGKVEVNGTRSIKEPKLWLVGYGDWVGYASATLVGVTRTARDTATQVAETIKKE